MLYIQYIQVSVLTLVWSHRRGAPSVLVLVVHQPLKEAILASKLLFVGSTVEWCEQHLESCADIGGSAPCGMTLQEFVHCRRGYRVQFFNEALLVTAIRDVWCAQESFQNKLVCTDFDKLSRQYCKGRPNIDPYVLLTVEMSHCADSLVWRHPT